MSRSVNLQLFTVLNRSVRPSLRKRQLQTELNDAMKTRTHIITDEKLNQRFRPVRAPVACFNPMRNRLSLITPTILTMEARAYLRNLRAAEMTDWEMTGGDYLLSHCAPRVPPSRSYKTDSSTS